MPVIHVAHSPDSDDAFMFYALAAGKVDTGDRVYEHELSDIESLNQRALRGELDVTAVSIHAYAHLKNRYVLLPHGASIGDGYGPRVVTRAEAPADVRSALQGKRIAIPGKLTTGFLALKLYQPDFEAVETPYDEIEGAVIDGAVDAGLLIHEGQLTYASKGLHLWLDMGEWWYDETGLPLPLGGNVIRRDLGDDLITEVSADLRKSILYALQHRQEALADAGRYARGLTPEQTDTFVSMYVNDYTVDYGEQGRRGVEELLRRGFKAGLVPGPIEVVFST